MSGTVVPTLPDSAHAKLPVRWLPLAATVLFFCLVCAPALVHVAKGSAQVLAGEKRMANPWPDLPGADRPWKTYVKELEAYLRDNFGARAWLLSQYHWLRYRYVGDYHTGSAKVQIGREGWLFYDMNSQVDAARGRWTLDEKHKDSWASLFHREYEAARQRGVPYVAVVAPNKNSVYEEKLPRWAARQYGPSATDQVLEHVRMRYPEIPIVDLRPVMRAIKHRPGIYIKTDVHWSQAAGWQAAKAILDVAAERVPSIVALPREDLYKVRPYQTAGGDLAARMNIRPLIEDQDFAMEFTGPALFSEVKATPWHELPRLSTDHPTFVYRSGQSQAPRVTVFRNSFMSALLAFLPAAFSETVVFWRPFEVSYVDLTKPDLVVRQILEMELFTPAVAPAASSR